MFATIITLSAMLILPIILFAIPSTRRMSGEWIAAFKTTPIGCIVALLVPIIFAVKSIVGSIILLILGLVLAMFTIRFLNHFIRKKMNITNPWKKIPFIIVFLAYVMVMPPLHVISSVAGFYILPHNDITNPWYGHQIMDDNNVKIIFESRGTHPFLAEYDYRLKFTTPEKTTTQMLFPNCGGRTHFNIYRLKDNRLLFIDKDNTYIVNTKKTKVLLVQKLQNQYYTSTIPNENITSWSPLYEDKGAIMTRINHKAYTATPLNIDLNDKTYYGAIKQKFIPATQQPEEPIALN